MKPAATALLVLALGAVTAHSARADIELDPDTEIFRRHFDEGRRSYALGRIESALAEFVEARSIKPLVAIDYYIAVCNDRLRRPAAALEAYRRYYLGRTDAADAQEVRARIDQLIEYLDGESGGKRSEDEAQPVSEPQLFASIAPASEVARPAERAPERLPVPSFTPPLSPPTVAPAAMVIPSGAPQPDRGRAVLAYARRHVLPISVGAGAFTLMIAGSGLVAAAAASPQSNVVGCMRSGCTAPRANDSQSQASAGYALLGVAAAASIADLALWIYDMHRDRPRPRLQLAPTLGGFRASLSF